MKKSSTVIKNKTESATIVDVANMAEVSISTVSRVINGQGGVSAKLEDRIQKAITTLNYKPNTVARALKSRSTHLIGVVLPSVSNPIFSMLAKAFETEAEKYGYSIILMSSNSSLEKEVDCINKLIEHRVDGLVFNGLGIYDPRFKVVEEAQIPVVFIGKRMEQFQYDNVTVNNNRSAYVAVDHLIRTGARSVGFIFGKHESVSATEDRFKGYLRALKDNGLEYNEKMVVRTRNYDDDGGRYATSVLLDACPDIDAIFASNDLMALGCLEQLRLSGKRVPEDIAVMGCDGIPYGRMMAPSLSTMVTPCSDMAKMAISALVDRINRSDAPYHEICFEAKMLLGGSTKRIEDIDLK